MGPKGLHRPQPIIFSCPNGHRIVADAAMAGKTGRCKECKVIVTVPNSPGVEPRPVSTSPAPVPVPPADPGAARASQPERHEPAESPSLIIKEPFPASGQAQASAEKTMVDRPTFDGDFHPSAHSIDPTEVHISFRGEETASSQSEAAPQDRETSQYVDAGPSASTALANPTARLMERLWYERRHGGVIEVHLTGAVSPILPTYFYPSWSDGTHGLFASLAADGTVTLTAVAWDSVQKIVVRHVDSIPPDFLDIGLEE